MTTYRTDSETYFQFNHVFYNEQINRVIDVVFPQFEQVIRRHLFFHVAFILLFASELFFFLFCFRTLFESSLIAISVGLMFLTLFSYFILKLYYQTHKVEQLEKIKQRFVRGCQELIHCDAGVPEQCIAIATAAAKMADRLERRESSHYSPPKWLKVLRPMMRKLSRLCHWMDYHRMRELLLMTAVEQYLELVRFEPTSLEVHASLANAYIMLSALYTDPKKIEGVDDSHWIPESVSQEMRLKFRTTAERAVEEFKILKTFAPDDPWVHTQLAYSYHDLQMPKEEIHEYETICRLVPDDEDSLFKLGALYFEQGMNARGLAVYEKLSHMSHKRADALIQRYGGSRSLPS